MSIRLRDPVHNFIRLTEKEVKVIDTPIFQRLRGIRQLALANLVYPGALHTRFDHCIGVCHIAGMMAEELGRESQYVEEKRELVRLAGLLHDVGHGPFSHVSEEILERYADRNALEPDQKKEKIHELITAGLVRRDTPLVDLLGRGTCEQIAQLLGRGYGDPVLRNMISGPLDADKQDYLLRDSRFCGVPYGVFDMHQLHRSFIVRENAGERELWIKPDGVHAVEQYILAKYYMTSNVYRHKVRLITDQMITRAITLGIEHDEIDALRSIYRYDGSDKYLKQYVQWDDHRFLEAFGGDAAPPGRCRDLLRRLERRRLLKRVYSTRIARFPDPEARAILADVSKPKYHDLRQSLESALAALISEELGTKVDAEFVILFAFSIKSVRTSARDDEHGIMVDTSPPQQFEKESTLLVSIDEGYKDEYVEVYAPLDWDEQSKKRRLLANLNEPIRQLLIDKCKVALGEGEEK